MQIDYVTGVPAPLWKAYVTFGAKEESKSKLYFLRWNGDLKKYSDTLEDLLEYTQAGTVTALAAANYNRVNSVQEQGEFSLKGDVIVVWPLGFTDPVRLSYFDNLLETVHTFDLLTGRRLHAIKQLPIGDLNRLASKQDWDNIAMIWNGGDFSDTMLVNLTVSDEKPNVEVKHFDFLAIQLFFRNFNLLQTEITRFDELGYHVVINTQHKQELPEELQHFCRTKLPANLPLIDEELGSYGFSSAQYKLLYITDREIFGTIFVTPSARKRLKSSEAQKLLSQLEGEIEVGDFIVHEDYGVGIYKGFTIEDGSDYLKLAYASDDELFVPLEQIYKLTKYLGDGNPEVTRLGRSDWETIKRAVKAQVAIAAKDLARHYAQAELATAMPVEKEDSPGYREFIDAFAFEPTTDQLKSEKEIIADLSKKRPMTRLLIGDVGYGKTEIIMRAAYKIAEAGGQVVILCPTTVLALQHYKTFTERFKNTPFNVQVLSRHNIASKNKEIMGQIKEGKWDIIIGTHRLLSADLEPKKLGLLVIDEEQRFGVKQKEKIRKLEFGVHNLYVSATPIPRTLSMALAGIEDISFIQTPPPGRKAVTVDVSEFDWNKVVVAIQNELNRKGQIFFIHNRIDSILSIATQLQQYIPGIRLAIAHGQMSAVKMDTIIADFYEQKYDLLLATTILENGIDMPLVNTLIVDHSERLGLAQMYQLRGRVGRSSKQAYSYFYYHGRSMQAQKEIEMAHPIEKEKLKPAKYLERLETILSAQELGSGFKVASRDLEIRGAGNLLGAEQHGNIKKVGYGLYMQMLAEEIEKIKG